VEKYKVTLTVEERHALDRMVSSGKAAARKLVHARILLLGDEGPAGPRCTDEEIVAALDVGLLDHRSRAAAFRDREPGVGHPSSATAATTRQGQDPRGGRAASDPAGL
jgi:hypothetical protein